MYCCFIIVYCIYGSCFLSVFHYFIIVFLSVFVWFDVYVFMYFCVFRMVCFVLLFFAFILHLVWCAWWCYFVVLVCYSGLLFFRGGAGGGVEIYFSVFVIYDFSCIAFCNTLLIGLYTMWYNLILYNIILYV